jgi:hypothetical protein
LGRFLGYETGKELIMPRRKLNERAIKLPVADRKIFKKMLTALTAADYRLSRREAIIEALRLEVNLIALCENPYRQPRPPAFHEEH